MVAASTLPPLQIDGTGNGTPAPQESVIQHFFHDTAMVASDVLAGAWNELTQHPIEVIEAGATGLATGLAITAAALLVAPELAVAAAIAGVGYGAYQLGEHIPGWIHDADIVNNVENFSAAEVAQAHTDLQDFGKGTTLLMAGVLGGLPSGAVFSAAEGAVNDLVLANSLLKSEIPGIANDVVQSATTTGAKIGDSSLPATQPSDLSMPVSQTTDAVVKNIVSEAPVQLASLTLEQSTEINQSVFRASQGEIVPSVKQLYQVRFEKAGSDRLFASLEHPEGVLAPEGQWIATRLNADGSPNIENGIVNSWTPDEAAILKGYKLTAEQLAENTDIVGWTNVDAPPVHMVQLKEPTDIVTSWSPMHGDAGAWLANYDYDPVTGTPGVKYAIVTAKSYADTYRPV